MNIGLITVHRAHNYGSVLQCYALQEHLKSCGHNVFVIDYRQRWTESVYKKFSFYYLYRLLLRNDLRGIIDYWKKKEKRRQRINVSQRIFKAFRQRFRLTKACINTIPSNFDIYIIGSDQLWSFECVGGYDKIYTGIFKRKVGSKVLGYALSSNVNSILKLGASSLKRVLSNFYALSFREEEIAETVFRLSGHRYCVTIDPTLLLERREWDSLVYQAWAKHNYIAIYQAREVPHNHSFLYEKAQTLASELRCEIIDLSDMSYSVEDFISIIKYAKYVLTTSFHAVVFSFIMETPCFAIKLGDGLDVRYINFLKQIGLEQELVEMDFTPHPVIIDFSKSKARLLNYRSSSIDFLNSSCNCK